MLARVSVGRGRDDQSGAVATDGGRVVTAGRDGTTDDAPAARGGDSDE
jgi:hypothetical protein